MTDLRSTLLSLKRVLFHEDKENGVSQGLSKEGEFVKAAQNLLLPTISTQKLTAMHKARFLVNGRGHRTSLDQ